MNPLSAVYGGAARLRRQWYVRNPRARRRLRRPVISVGNLVVGGSGKTPVVAALASMLRAQGERPAIVSRGYARREKSAGVLVVSDGERVLEPVERSGDEPQMLARSLPGIPVLVSPDRYAAGCVADSRFGSTVILLDDGFQHVQLARDVDLLLVSPSDLAERVLPAGRLREPLDAAAAATALLVPGSAADAERVGARLGAERVFRVEQEYGAPVLVNAWGSPAACPPGTRVVAVAGIARPRRFFDALRAQGFDVARELAFADHRWFSDRDIERVATAARDAGTDLVLTTEKDAVRLEGRVVVGAVPAFVPMRAVIEPAEAFAAWLKFVMGSGVIFRGHVTEK